MNTTQGIQTTPAERWQLSRELGPVIAIGLAARLAVLLLVLRLPLSHDLWAWRVLADVLAAGQNPYQVQKVLMWPPALMQIIFVLDHLAARLGLSLDLLIRLVLILADTATVLIVAALIRRLTVKPMRGSLLIGWSLNPVAILLVCLHGNFDVLVSICILGMLMCLLHEDETSEPVAWLWACFWVGCGIILKTIPLVLLPLLVVHRKLSRQVVALGGILALGPVAYGVSIIYALAPAQTRATIFGYRSAPGWFGVTGILTAAGSGAALQKYRGLFVPGMVAAMLIVAWLVRRGLSPTQTVAAATALLAAIPALGPGYASQYISWFLPLLIVMFIVGRRPLRLVVATFGLVASATYVVEYALRPPYGAFLSAISQRGVLARATQWLMTQPGATCERLPLFAAYLALLAVLVRTVMEHRSSSQDDPSGSEHRVAAA